MYKRMEETDRQILDWGVEELDKEWFLDVVTIEENEMSRRKIRVVVMRKSRMPKNVWI